MLVVFDTTVLVGALCKPFGASFRLLRLVQGLPLVDGLITDVTGWEFVRVASGLGYQPGEIEAFLDAFDPLFEHDEVAKSPVTRRLLGNALDNVSLEGAALHLAGKRLVDFKAELPPAIVAAHESRDENDLHVVWAVVSKVADFLCTADAGFPEMIGGAAVRTPMQMLEVLAGS